MKHAVIQLQGKTLMMLLIISISAVPSVYAQTPGYPPPPPSNILVHTTTIVQSGEPNTQFTFNVTQTDSQSVVTEIGLTSIVPLSSLGIHIFQLSGFPTGVTRAPGVSLLIVQLDLLESVEKNIAAAMIDFKVPQALISNSNVYPSSLVVQRYFQGSWSELSSKVVDTDSEFAYLQSQSQGLSFFAVTGVELPPRYEYIAFSVVGVTFIVIAVVLISLWRKQKTMPRWTKYKTAPYDSSANKIC